MAPTYDYLYTDPQGVQVFQGSDGGLYTWSTDPNQPNGFAYVPYTEGASGGDVGGTIANPTSTAPQPDPTQPGPSGGGGGGGGTPMPGGGGPQPTFTPPGYTPPPPFDYADFVAPSPEELQNDPQYQYTLKTQQDALQKSAAARGILNTGGTINDLLMNAKDIASTGYHDLWGRKADEYGRNRQNAVDKYNINYGTQYVDPYRFSYQGAQDAYNSQIHNYDLNRQYGWYGTLLDFEKDKDAFDRRFRLLSV